MEVTLKIRTSKDPARVYISGSMNFQSANGLDEFLRTVKLSRDWLAKQPRVISEPEK